MVKDFTIKKNILHDLIVKMCRKLITNLFWLRENFLVARRIFGCAQNFADHFFDFT